MDDGMCSFTVPGRTPGRLPILGRIRRDPQCSGVLQRPLTSHIVPVLIHCLPGKVVFALNREHSLVHLPLITGPRASAIRLVGIWLAICTAPRTDGFLGYDDSTYRQERFEIVKAQAASQGEPYGVAEDLHRNVVILADDDML